MATYTTQITDIDMHLAQLLGTMTLIGGPDIAREEPLSAPAAAACHPDAHMCELPDIEDSTRQRNLSGSSNTSTTKSYGCGYLQAIQSQVLSGRFSTTSGEYLEAIFTHRDAFSAYPPAHKECAIAFSDLAEALAARDCRADREGDLEAVAAFRNEAWTIASVC